MILKTLISVQATCSRLTARHQTSIEIGPFGSASGERTIRWIFAAEDLRLHPIRSCGDSIDLFLVLTPNLTVRRYLGNDILLHAVASLSRRKGQNGNSAHCQSVSAALTLHYECCHQLFRLIWLPSIPARTLFAENSFEAFQQKPRHYRQKTRLSKARKSQLTSEMNDDSCEKIQV